MNLYVKVINAIIVDVAVGCFREDEKVYLAIGRMQVREKRIIRIRWTFDFFLLHYNFKIKVYNEIEREQERERMYL